MIGFQYSQFLVIQELIIQIIDFSRTLFFWNLFPLAAFQPFCSFSSQPLSLGKLCKRRSSSNYSAPFSLVVWLEKSKPCTNMGSRFPILCDFTILLWFAEKKKLESFVITIKWKILATFLRKNEGKWILNDLIK